jgi:hypothetical protein
MVLPSVQVFRPVLVAPPEREKGRVEKLPIGSGVAARADCFFLSRNQRHTLRRCGGAPGKTNHYAWPRVVLELS